NFSKITSLRRDDRRVRTRPSQRAAMGAKKADKKVDPAVEELLSSDIWDKDQCNVCQEECPTREMKIAHAKTPKHSKKMVVFKFLTKEAPGLAVTRPSKLVERYKDKGHEGVGLDCIHEFVFSFAESGWWACSLCYETGFNYEQIDEHLNSGKHLHHFLEEFHPAKAKKMNKDWGQTERLEFLLDSKKQIYFEETKKGAELAAPEILDLSSWTLQMARKRLMVDDTEKEYTVHSVAEDSSNVMLQCQTCHVTLPCRKDCVEDAWTRHRTTERHKRLSTINCILRQYHFEREQEDDRMMTELSEETLRWKHVDDRVYGPVCGVKYLRKMGDKALCTLCGVMVENVDEHFASEIHLARFVCTQSPREGWQMMMASKDARREKLLTMLQSAARENEESRWTREECPGRLTWSTMESPSEELPRFPPHQEPFGFNSACIVCEGCWLALPTPSNSDPNAIWNEHVFSNEHLDLCARRYTIDYDALLEYCVPVASSVQLLPRESHGKWVTESVGDEVAWKYQTQTDVGLEYVVEDVDLGMAVCVLCARSYALGDNCMMGRHVRSVQHLQQYMHVTSRTMLSMVLDTKIEATADEIMIEFLQRNMVSSTDEIRVFNKKKTKEMESWPRIKLRTMQINATTSDIRPIFDCIMSMVDRVANDKGEERAVCAREALLASQVKEITITRMVLLKTGLILFKCGTCEMSFTASPLELEKDVWERHIGSEEHFRRALEFANNKFSPLYITPLSSTYTVKPFVQKDLTKKVTWRWNGKSHDLVLSVVGLEELVEKKSEDSMLLPDANIENFTAHFFCRVCAVVVGRRAQVLENHVRSSEHVLNYVNKHYPQTILELERLDNNDGGKEKRKILANLLKDIKAPAEYCIPVYDPIGESDRRQKEAEIKLKQRENMRKNEEMRQKAMEERKKKDEERRKAKEEETKREKEREEERKKREAAVLEKAAAMSAERERLRKLALEKAALAEIARKKEEMALAQSQLTRDPAIAALLSQRAQISSQLDALRAAKASAAPPEPRLIIPGPNQLAGSSALNPAILPTVHISGVPPTGTSSALPMTSHPPPLMSLGTSHTQLMGALQQPMQQQPPMAFPPPGAGMYSMPPPMGAMGMGFNMPPPSLLGGAAPMSVPPPSMGVPPPSILSQPPPLLPDLVGPKPVLSSFVPKVDAMPVYPSMGVARAAGSLARRGDFERLSLAGAQPDFYVTNPAIITNRQALVDYMWKQGNEETPESERPARFSRLCAATPACLGMEYIYEVVCVDSVDLTTMYCSMCGFWSTPMDTVKHMLAPSHRLLYLFRNYKFYHTAVESEVDQRAKEILLEQFAMQIRSRDNPPPFVTHRLKCYLNTATIQRLWPQYVNVLDQTWRSNPICRTPSPPARRGRSRSYSSDSRSRSYSRSRSPSPKDRYRRSRSRDRHHKRRSSRSRDRSRSRSPRRGSRRKSSSRSRSGSPIKKTWPEAMNGSMMGGGGMMGGAMNASLPPPSLMGGFQQNMNVPPPAGVQTPKQTHVITLDDEDMQISTTPSPKEKKKDERRERGRDKEVKSSTPRKDRSRSRERSSRREKERKEKEREKDKKKEKKEEEVDPVREAQAKKAMERIREVERQKKEQKEKEREKKAEGIDERLRRDRRERSRERRRSPSPSRKRKRSESRERRSSHRSSNGGDGGEVDWESKAAAFLAKIGDLQGASKLIQGPGSSQQAASSSPYASAPPVYNGAPTGRPGSGMAGYEPLTASPSDFGAVAAGKRKKEEASPAYEPLFDESSSAARPSRGAAPSPSVEDPEMTKRKLLGVLVTMQRETESGKELSEKDVDRIYQEVGLAKREKNEELLAQLIEMVAGDKAPTKKPSINLQEYGIGPASASPAQHHGSPYYGGASSSRGAPHPSPGYGSEGRDYYGSMPHRPDPRSPPSHSGLDAGDFELLKNLRNTLKLMQTMAPPTSGPRSLPMPPGYGRPEYDRRESYPPPSSAYPPYRSPADEDPRIRRPVYDDPRYLDPRADPRMRERYPPDARYRGYYDDPYERGPPPTGYGAYDRDPRALRPGMDPRDARDPHAAARPPMGGLDPRLYEPPVRREDRLPPLTREEYEARLRGEAPPTQPAPSAHPPAAAARAPAAAPAKKADDVVTIDDDDDWGSIEQILENSKAAKAAAAPAATGGNREPLQTAAKNAVAPSTAAAAAAPETEMSAAKAKYMERQAAVRQHWGVKNKAAPAPQPHLTGQPTIEAVGFPSAPRQPQHLPPSLLSTNLLGGVSTGGQWDAAYTAPQRVQQQLPQQHQQQHQQQPQQGHYSQYGQNPGGYNGSYGGGYY
ncbi:hypothetical protein PMAYCL1PPCAC_11672, partial [Pristionchus mayeri]